MSHISRSCETTCSLTHPLAASPLRHSGSRFCRTFPVTGPTLHNRPLRFRPRPAFARPVCSSFSTQWTGIKLLLVSFVLLAAFSPRATASAVLDRRRAVAGEGDVASEPRPVDENPLGSGPRTDESPEYNGSASVMAATHVGFESAKVKRQSGGTPSSGVMSDPNAPTNTQLPTPFDTNLGNNFTSSSCPLFFSSFLNDPQLKSCHPISLLLTVRSTPASPSPFSSKTRPAES